MSPPLESMAIGEPEMVPSGRWPLLASLLCRLPSPKQQPRVVVLLRETIWCLGLGGNHDQTAKRRVDHEVS